MNKKILILFLLVAFSPLAVADEIARPETWATPVAGDVVKNLYRLDSKVYRSAQPDDEEMAELKALGIREVLNLRQYHSDNDEAKGTGLILHHVPMNAGEIRDADVIAALKIIREAKGPIVIHCWHGSDRTGTIVAMYRIIFQGWSKQTALKELEEGGYGFHAMVYKNIPQYIMHVDVAQIRKALDIHG